MTLDLFEKVVLTRNLADHGLRAGDVGVITDRFPAAAGRPASYELEFFSPAGETIAVVSVPSAAVREATVRDWLSERRQHRRSS
jgi:hypothetical protein